MSCIDSNGPLCSKAMIVSTKLTDPTLFSTKVRRGCCCRCAIDCWHDSTGVKTTDKKAKKKKKKKKESLKPEVSGM